METVYYTLTRRETVVAGDCVASAAGAPEHRTVCVRAPSAPAAPARRDNVIDLAAWKQAREGQDAPEDREALAEAEGPVPVRGLERIPRRRILLMGGEGLATLSVILTMVLLMLRIAAM